MPRGLTASTIKSWFQYRCERKVRYELSSDDELSAVPIIKDIAEQAWAVLGQDFEKRVCLRLSRSPEGLLQPAPGEFGLDQRLAAAFLRGVRPEAYAAQINLRPNRPPKFLAGTGLELARTYPDLVRISNQDGRVVFTIIDVKATRRATAFHKTQVAFYVRVLEELLLELNITAEISPLGEIWRIPDDGTAEGDRHQAEIFALAPYLRLVDEFCRDELPIIASKRVARGVDETFFHIYFKCEQCSFLGHCTKSIDPDRPAARRDVSAVPGLTHEAKRTLLRLGQTSVANLAVSPGFGQATGVGWSLSRRAPLLIRRAQALTRSAIHATDEKQTFLMPPRVDAAFLLSVDHDPIDDRLAAIGYRMVKSGESVREVIRVPKSGASADEVEAMAEVLGLLIEDLGAIDAANATAGEDGIFAHIFLYEPPEAINLQQAVGRHLEDPRIRGGLLHLVRLFPPEDIVPEPEFRGIHHLPATAVRSVMEQLFALPVQVSYDLRQVSQALESLGGGGPAYVPADGFERPFSSLLSIEVIRNRRDKRPAAKSEEAICRDVHNRLSALDGVIKWLLLKNQQATREGAPILRLAKKPFRLQATFDPLNAVDLDVLLACEILENRAGMLDALIALAQPASVRRDRGRCYAGLTLVRHWAYGGSQVMAFKVPPESQQAELGPGDFNLILTDDDPDLRLNTAMWGAVRCQIRPADNGYESRRDLLQVSMRRPDFNAEVFQRLLGATPRSGWFIDQAFGDVNTDKAARFLSGLAGIEA